MKDPLKKIHGVYRAVAWQYLEMPQYYTTDYAQFPK
jgi:hypothetical protein